MNEEAPEYARELDPKRLRARIEHLEDFCRAEQDRTAHERARVNGELALLRQLIDLLASGRARKKSPEKTYQCGACGQWLAPQGVRMHHLRFHADPGPDDEREALATEEERQRRLDALSHFAPDDAQRLR